ncbi:MAG: molybdopterin-dependent oxidoreductase [Candidatus Tectomicrobia bacterium]|nr:molybdopterin-dependent oxidoreductase [Candidatus Tectomicrobia bacterium]
MPIREIRTYDAQSKSQSGIICVVEDGRLVEVRPDPDHPNGPHEIELDPKSKALPELLYHPERLKHPLRRTRPKTSPDPGWERISWEEALDAIARKLLEIRETSGPEAVDFHRASPGGAASSDYNAWFHRLAFTFGSPNISSAMYICNWHKDFASRYTYGSGIAEPDFDQTACIVLWGHNPENTWRGHYRKILQALDRGAKFIVVDPRRIPLAERADLWLPVRPGTDGCLALGMLDVLIGEGLFDREFARTWTTGPFAVREDTGRFLRQSDLDPEGSRERFAVWDEGRGRLATLHPLDDPGGISPALSARGTARLRTGETAPFRTAWDHLVEAARRIPLEEVSRVTGVPTEDIRRATRMLATVKPSCYYTYNGVEQHPNATQTNRAISLLFLLTGQCDAPGANVNFPGVKTEGVAGVSLLPPGQREKNLARARFPLGPPATASHLPPYEVFRAILTGKPYPIRAIVSFGGNILLSTCDTLEGEKALEKLEFFVLAELFETPVARFADILLPASTFLESSHVKTGFGGQGAAANTFLQLRKEIVPPMYESWPDMKIIFELARRLGLGDRFWGGDVRAAFDAQLAPAGLSVEDLEKNPGGVSVPLPVEHRKYRVRDPQTGRARGFKTATGRVEVYLESFLEHSQPPVPEFVPPRPAGAEDPGAYPLTMITAKVLEFCHGQHRALPSLRRLRPEPQVDIHPQTAKGLGVKDGDWVRLRTPQGGVRVRARLTDAIRPDVVCTQHGWWQGCRDLGLPGYDVFSEQGANLNRIIGSQVVDPVSGATPNRSSPCRIEPLTP